jgi:energy-coupling factor transport system substrate-specific component
MNSRQNKKITIKEIAVFGMLGALLFASKIAMEALPNIHLLATLVISITVVYRKKALYPIYIFVLITGLLNGFGTWWVPYLYIWTVLWGVTMFLPKNINPKIAPVIYMIVCALHGFLYGTLYAPAQALFFNLDFNGTIAWIIAGLPYDLIHGASNFLCGILIVPIINVLKKVNRN